MTSSYESSGYNISKHLNLAYSFVAIDLEQKSIWLVQLFSLLLFASQVLVSAHQILVPSLTVKHFFQLENCLGT